jgi:hypothetical protein
MQTRSNLTQQLLISDAPDLPVKASNHEQLAHTPTNSPNKDLPRDEKETSAFGSEKGYEEAPTFEIGVYDDKSVKELARIEYSIEEDMPELEDSDNDVPDEHNPGATRRRIADTPEDDYPDPIGGGDMRLAPEKNVYVGAISGKLKNQTPQKYLEARTETVWLLEIARLKERHAEILKRAQSNVVNKQVTVGEQSPAKHQGDENGAPLRQ